jgi:hypothetical protein
MKLIQSPTSDERCFVESLDGYSGWVVLAEDLDPLPHPYFTWDGEALVEDFGPLNTALLAKIDREAGEFRTRFITSIPGQETTYRLKEDEALAWEDGVSDPADFPYLREEAAAKGVNVAAIAELVLATAAQWRGLNPKIEAARTAAKDAVLAANTIAAKQAAASVDWEALL